MKVKITNTNSDVGSAKPGECFWYHGLLYMRIVPDGMIFDTNGEELVPAVLLSTGKINWLEPDTQVEKCDCTVVSSDLVPQEKDKFEI